MNDIRDKIYLTIFANIYTMDVWQGPKYTSEGLIGNFP